MVSKNLCVRLCSLLRDQINKFFTDGPLERDEFKIIRSKTERMPVYHFRRLNIQFIILLLMIFVGAGIFVFIALNLSVFIYDRHSPAKSKRSRGNF